MNYLNYDDFLEIGENLEYGQKVRVNHINSDCDGSSKSMLIERKDNGDISAYCFRCGGRGFYGSKTALKSKILGEASTTESHDANRSREIPSDAEADITAWPSAARVWLRRYGITDKEITDARITYSASLNRLILPVFDNDGLASYQTRKVHDRDTAPKYLSVRNRNSPNTFGGGNGSTIVLVEDTVSGIKVARFFPTLVLNGTSLQDHHLKYIISGNFSCFYVWLDDDNPIVQKNALKIKKTLDKLGVCTVVHTDGKDPKEHTDDEIKEILT